MTKTITISRLAENEFSAVTNVPMTDGSFQSDLCMKLVGSALRSHSDGTFIRIDCGMRVNLGPVSFAAVSALAIGQSVTL